MKKLFLSILLFASTSFGAVIDDNCKIKVGGRCFTNSQVNASTFKLLKCYGTTSSNCAFMEGIGQTGYSVPSSTQLRILALVIDHNNTGGSLWYSDDDIGPSTTSTGTNPVYMFNDGVNANLTNQAGIGSPNEFLMNIIIPTGKYLNWDGGTSGNWAATIIGIEEPN